MTDHITLPRSVVEQAIINIERMQVEANAPESFRQRAVELAETSVTALRAALAGAAQAEPVAERPSGVLGKPCLVDVVYRNYFAFEVKNDALP